MASLNFFFKLKKEKKKNFQRKPAIRVVLTNLTVSAINGRSSNCDQYFVTNFFKSCGKHTLIVFDFEQEIVILHRTVVYPV